MNSLMSANTATFSNTVLAASDGLTFLCVFILGTMLTWWAVGILKWDKFTHDPYGRQARVLRLIFGCIGGALFGVVAVIYVIAIQLIRGA